MFFKKNLIKIFVFYFALLIDNTLAIVNGFVQKLYIS